MGKEGGRAAGCINDWKIGIQLGGVPSYGVGETLI